MAGLFVACFRRRLLRSKRQQSFHSSKSSKLKLRLIAGLLLFLKFGHLLVELCLLAAACDVRCRGGGLLCCVGKRSLAELVPVNEAMKPQLHSSFFYRSLCDDMADGQVCSWGVHPVDH